MKPIFAVGVWLAIVAAAFTAVVEMQRSRRLAAEQNRLAVQIQRILARQLSTDGSEGVASILQGVELREDVLGSRLVAGSGTVLHQSIQPEQAGTVRRIPIPRQSGSPLAVQSQPVAELDLLLAGRRFRFGSIGLAALFGLLAGVGASLFFRRLNSQNEGAGELVRLADSVTGIERALGGEAARAVSTRDRETFDQLVDRLDLLQSRVFDAREAREQRSQEHALTVGQLERSTAGLRTQSERALRQLRRFGADAAAIGVSFCCFGSKGETFLTNIERSTDPLLAEIAKRPWVSSDDADAGLRQIGYRTLSVESQDASLGDVSDIEILFTLSATRTNGPSWLVHGVRLSGSERATVAIRTPNAREQLQRAAETELNALAALCGTASHDATNFLSIVLLNLEMLCAEHAAQGPSEDALATAQVAAESAADVLRSLERTLSESSAGSGASNPGERSDV